jgi:hypothetical protein
MATEKEVQARREENERLREQIATLKANQARELSEANHDIALERQDREHANLEAELATLMAKSTDRKLTAPPAPDTTLVAETPVAATVDTDSAPAKP